MSVSTVIILHISFLGRLLHKAGDLRRCVRRGAGGRKGCDLASLLEIPQGPK